MTDDPPISPEISATAPPEAEAAGSLAETPGEEYPSAQDVSARTGSGQIGSGQVEPGQIEPGQIEPGPTYDWPAPQEPLAQMQPLAPPPPPPLIPHMGNFGVFLVLLIVSLFVAVIGIVVVLHFALPHEAANKLIANLTQNILVAMSMQGVWYGCLWGLTALVLGLWWKTVAGVGFLQGIQWNAGVAKRRFFLLAGAGLATGLLVTLAGNFVPMPKAPPILEDLTKSPLGAWALMIFGVTLAPLTEELAFRGLLLPGLINVFRWLQRKGSIGEETVRTIGIPLSIVLTSLPFAFMHAQQVSFSWGPVLLIGCVSIILCIVRLRTKSLASSILVHSFYNLTLFTGLLIQTDGFRHLEKLKG
ncbi:MAG TPA: CPBP family intramembrane glutamic endopeptidase [Acidobacteriaceae bacterium]|jgi:hypothetical protein|nr:CPBP family intramembrane glutamic endopeptidase [Acidobacteriaceae bacterium]